MTRQDVDQICASFPGAELALPPELVSWKVGGKMFACLAGDEGQVRGVSVKTADVETAAMLIDAGEAVRAPYFHKSWVRLPFEATDRAYAEHRITVSYDLIRKSLKKSVRDALPEREAP
ncbi:MAG: MmcQ/YjbR family DNA-binding protein [Pseudomonadota bacterium]